MCVFCALQEWPEEDYPIYANGPGYVISSDIADSILSEFVNHKLRVSSVDCFCSAFHDTNRVPHMVTCFQQSACSRIILDGSDHISLQKLIKNSN